MHNLRRHRKTDPGFCDLLNYAAVVADGVVLNKNGSLMAAWLYRGADNASATDDQRAQVARFVATALQPLGNGWMIHVDAARHETDAYSAPSASKFPDRLSAAIDDERRRHFQTRGRMYEAFFVITVTWFPPAIAQRRFVELMFDDDAPKPSTGASEGLIAQFEREIRVFEQRMSVVLQLTRLRGEAFSDEDGRRAVADHFLSWLTYCVSGDRHMVRLPPTPMYLDAVIGSHELYGGVTPRLGRRFIQVVAIDGFPAESYPGILSSLAELPCEYRWSSRFIFLERHAGIAHLNKYRKRWKQKIRGFFDQVFHINTGPVDEFAVAMVEDADRGIAEINSGLVSYGYYTSVVVLMDDNRAVVEAAAADIAKAIGRHGFTARVETVNTLDAYLGSLPGHGVENVRRPLLNTLNVADLIPTSSIWTGSDAAPCPMYPPASPPLMHCVTEGQTPFRLNLHVGDLGHTIIFGPPGMGKSTHLALLATQLRRYPGMKIFAFDKGFSLLAITRGVGGSHFAIADDNARLAFAPLQFLDTRADRAWAMEWIETICRLNGVNPTPAQRGAIGDAIISMHKSSAKTLSEFQITIQDPEIRAVIEQYTIDSTAGHLLDAEADGLSLTDFSCFETSELLNLGDRLALPVLLYLFRRTEVEIARDGSPAAIIIDEAWIALGHPAFRAKIREWLKVLRKLNCVVILATQSLADAANSGILDTIVEATATKIYLPNVAARDEDASALYRRMGLNSRQIEIIAQAAPKRDYYVVSAAGRRKYSLALGPLAAAFCAVSDADSIATINELYATHGDQWVSHWLARRNLSLPHQEANE